MSSFLYYSISSNFMKDEIIEIEKRVAKNRESVYLFLRNLPPNSKRKAKRWLGYAIFVFQLGQPLVRCAAAVIVPLPPTAVHRLSPIKQDRIIKNKNGHPQIATISVSKVNKIRLTNDQIQQFNYLPYSPLKPAYLVLFGMS